MGTPNQPCFKNAFSLVSLFIKMKVIVVALAVLIVQAYSRPVDDEDSLNMLSVDFDENDECRTLLSGKQCDMLESFDEATYGDIVDLTDAAIEKILEEKLKIFDWLIGHIPIPDLQNMIRDFISQNRDQIKDALKKGALGILDLIRKLVFDKILG